MRLLLRQKLRVTSVLVGALTYLVAVVEARCECGYALAYDTSVGEQRVFTDLIESDFLHIRDISLSTDWQRQNFTKTPEVGRGPYGMNFTVSNVFSNPIADHGNWTGPGELGGDPGVHLTVKGGIPSDNYVDLAQMDSLRSDLLWGSYRAAMKLSPVAGTCAAFFWYFNDSQEVDMEFLSKDFDFERKIFPVNLVLQTPKSAQAGFSEKGANNYVLANLAFDPTTAYHEYRMDLIPGKVIFYADGQQLATMNTSFTPIEPGHMILTHWSNGNTGWTAGPPAIDAPLSVSYVKAYFNSSDAKRQQQAAARCDLTKPDPICTIPDQMYAPDLAASNPSNNSKSAAEVLFFTDEPETRAGQIFYDKNDGHSEFVLSRLMVCMLMLSFGVAFFS